MGFTFLANHVFAASNKQPHKKATQVELECGPMPNVMAALLNIGGALCSTLQCG